MSRINTNVPALVATRILSQNTQKLNTTLQRLSTGLRINSGKDDPAGLIASEGLRSQIAGINAAIDNANRADSVVSIAEGGLSEVNSLLTDLQGLVNRSANEAGLSDGEVKANQLQIDSILDSINRIANATNFNGKKLLDGSLDYTTSGVTTGPSASAIADLKINSARLANNATRGVTVQVTQSAQTGQLVFSGNNVGASAVTIQVGGNAGSDVFSFAASTAASAVVAAVNASKALTGVSAALSGSATIKFDSVGYGSDSFVSVAAQSGTFAVTGGSSATRDEGQDAGVLINGAAATVKGLQASVHTAGLDADLTLATAFATQTAAAASFTITGGGATFSIGAELGINANASIGIANINTGTVGDGSVGFLNSLGSGLANDLASGNFSTAQKIVDAAANQVSSLRGRLGAFQKNTLGSTINSLQVALENTTAAESAIRDADFAKETGNLTRAQILQQAAQSALQLANQAPTSVLNLLR